VVTGAVAALMTRLGATLRNQYGPTETHVATELSLAGPPEAWPARPSIGHPIAGVHAYVLDRSGRPTPVGVAGELHLGGLGVARGYLGRADLTAERFVPDPFGTSGATMVRTGDRARRLAGGEIEFMGRLDDQLKIRGFRIEPGEIDAVLADHPAVRSAVVAAWPGARDDMQLVAYVVLEPGTGASDADLGRFLARRLPSYMIPAAFVRLPSLPLSANGKIDHGALAPPDRLVARRAETRVAPRSDLEEQLAAIWREVLAVPDIGVDDEFFDLGGHSLLATQVVSHVRHDLGVDLSLRRFFEPPSTIAALSVAVVASRLTSAPDPASAEAELAVVEAMTVAEVGLRI